MAAIASNPLFVKLHDNRGMIFPIAFISLVLVILVPLPTQVLDILLLLQHHAVGDRDWSRRFTSPARWNSRSFRRCCWR